MMGALPFEELDGHHARRNDGLPIVSVLLGPPVLARRQFLAWAARKARPVAQLTTLNQWSAIEVWLNALWPELDLVSLALERFGNKVRLQKAEAESKLRELPEHVRRSLLENAFDQRIESASECLCFNLLLHSGDLSSAQVLIEISRHWFGYHRDGRKALVSALLGMNLSTIPAIWYQSGHLDRVDQVESAAELLGDFAIQFPMVCVAWGVEKELFEKYTRIGSDSRNKSICGYTIPIPLVDASIAIAESDHALGDSVRYIASQGATPDQVQELEVLHETIRRAKDAGDQERARSRAEAFLFDRLQSLPETSGLFKLNDHVCIPFHQGGMEVDLVNHQYKIAIEVDGYYHFCNEDAYRRDRRKDFLLQKHGYIILRCLATEVVSNLEQLFERILDTVRFRREFAMRREDEGRH